MLITDLLQPEHIWFIDLDDKTQVMTRLVEKAKELQLVSTQGSFLQAILDREQIMSTGLGLGVAVPHAKLSEVKEFFVLIGILNRPVPWDSLDKLPVSLVFLIGGPADRQTDYLKLLSKITLVIKNPQRREALLKAQTTKEVLTQFEGL
jgi:mannitol/fructose-specific phosphotransferase system IIA component (Ntr-type)